jgi:hypothetical protein
MSDTLAALASDPARLEDVLASELPALAGEAAALHARILARLVTPPAPAPSPATNGKGPDRWLDAEAVAERMGFVDDDGAPDRRRVYRRASGWKFARKVGGVWRFSEQGLVRWMEVQQ